MKNAPLADAAMEIKLTATTAHLWFEEIIVGAENKEVIEKVWQLLDESLWYVEAMLKGGTNAEGIFLCG
ncbi:sensory box/GGDEF/GAF/EAL domain protein [Beggiatoa sp. PS]|nr:sensory box/GGDEF/GAF/EAL domain protein [Beggiatoa sp. PS]